MAQVIISAEDKIKKARLLSRVLMVMAGLCLFLNLLLVLTMYQMGGRLTVMTQLVNMRNRGTETMVLSDIMNKNLDNLDVLEKAFVRRFIEERNFQIPDQFEMLRRWGFGGTLSLMSSPSVFPIAVSKDDKRLKDAMEQYPTHADNIQILSRVGRSWRVSFDLWTHTPSGSIKKEKEANVVVDFSPNYEQKVATPGYYYNPLGMLVIGYLVTDKAL